MSMQEKEYIDSKTFNKFIFDKSLDEVKLHFKILEKNLFGVLNEFTNQTKNNLDYIKSEYDENQEANYAFNRLKSKIKISSKEFEKKIENLIDDWNKNVKKGVE